MGGVYNNDFLFNTSNLNIHGHIKVDEIANVVKMWCYWCKRCHLMSIFGHSLLGVQLKIFIIVPISVLADKT